MNKIIYIADPEILAIPVEECHEPLVDVANKQALLYGPPPECELTAPCYTKMRKSIFEKLLAAEKRLPSGWRFILYEGYRSLAVQKMLFEQEYQRVSAKHPELSPEDLFHETTRLVSPVINLDGTHNIPPHNTGAAVDVELLDEHGQLVDMGMAAKDWCVVDPDLCLTHCDKISEHVKSNRKILLDVMHAEGFVNYPTEWWHFSYGDRYWAYHRGVDAAMYGSVEVGLSAS